MSFIKKILWHEYGIKVATIRLRGSINWYGNKYYLPYKIDSCCSGSVANLLNGSSYQKLYRNIESILEDARKGELYENNCK